MTVINTIEFNKLSNNIINDAIINNLPLEDKLHVIAVVSNPCLFAKRYKLMKEFIYRMEKNNHVELYIVELVYKDQQYHITDNNNDHHLQLRIEDPLWHKENMINLGVKYLLPENWKAFAWIDADIEFENHRWAEDTLKILNGSRDIVQIFSHCIDMNNDELALNIFNSAGFMYTHNKKFCNKGNNYWHPGYAWAITRRAYEQIGGLYELGILGSGDFLMLMSIINLANNATNKKFHPDYNKSILNFQQKAKNLRLGYVPGVIKHYFHGSKFNRKYHDRYLILIKYKYSPFSFITKDINGVIIPTSLFPNEFKQEICNYFWERKEDD
jgi:hypothetical protein